MSFDTVVRGGTIDVAIADGVIAEVAPGRAGRRARETIDATGLHVLPGVIDAHVHFNEPGRTDWEGFATRHARAGGRRRHAPSTCRSTRSRRPSTRARSTRSSPRRRARRSSTSRSGAGSCRATSTQHGRAGRARRGRLQGVHVRQRHRRLPGLDDLTLLRGHGRAARARPAGRGARRERGDHARLGRRALAAGRTAMRDFLASRPVVAELEAIARAIALADETGCALHIVHVSSGRGVALVAEARAARRRRDLRDLPALPRADRRGRRALGALAKCAPPLRTAAERDGLWRAAARRRRSTASPPTTRPRRRAEAGRRLRRAWGGISGCQSTARLLLTEGLARSDARAPRAPAAPAERFGCRGRAASSRARDADLLSSTSRAEASADAPTSCSTATRTARSSGRTLRGRVARTLLRGPRSRRRPAGGRATAGSS